MRGSWLQREPYSDKNLEFYADFNTVEKNAKNALKKIKTILPTEV